MENSNDTGKIVASLFIGALTGAALGILFAPDKGSRTRSKIAGGARDFADNLQQKIRDEAMALRNKAEEIADLAEEKMSEMANSVK